MRSPNKHTALLGLAFAAMAALSGCASRQLVSFQTHPDQDTMLMETLETQDYLVWKKREHAFWSCDEQGDSLECTRRCGKGTDLSCPEVAIFSVSGSTNVR